jgi:hypothetical protein
MHYLTLGIDTMRSLGLAEKCTYSLYKRNNYHRNKTRYSDCYNPIITSKTESELSKCYKGCNYYEHQTKTTNASATAKTDLEPTCTPHICDCHDPPSSGAGDMVSIPTQTQRVLLLSLGFCFQHRFAWLS